MRIRSSEVMSKKTTIILGVPVGLEISTTHLPSEFTHHHQISPVDLCFPTHLHNLQHSVHGTSSDHEEDVSPSLSG